MSAEDAERYHPEMPEVTEVALAGDEAAIGVFDLVGSRLGVALTSFANIFEPEVFVIGGGVAATISLLSRRRR